MTDDELIAQITQSVIDGETATATASHPHCP